ncbi:MAG: hypothetical protein KC583_21165, partial [Myxococcales bacterium]|nr:hypothetical protein [Myxococcales bacterium]
DSPCSAIQLVVVPGTYVVQVTEFGNDAALPGVLLQAEITPVPLLTPEAPIVTDIGEDIPVFAVLDIGAAAQVTVTADDDEGACPEAIDIGIFSSDIDGFNEVDTAFGDPDSCTSLTVLLEAGLYLVRVDGPFFGPALDAVTLSALFEAPPVEP